MQINVTALNLSNRQQVSISLVNIENARRIEGEDNFGINQEFWIDTTFQTQNGDMITKIASFTEHSNPRVSDSNWSFIDSGDEFFVDTLPDELVQRLEERLQEFREQNPN
jgi:hypothetical protein